ncbi:GerAB/ArcD/ProY family transporter [Cohnella silvisoli]|uniref:Endospore germination permease n=1 Tax=Cohnella silvisoli TaxID=2873699 RepID=A0ABV1KQS9_9BACL|nr:endospore germination permease [Cohnella silvisoli]MCD9024616.1 spore germination protein [Cohnella silvisoli]
MFSSQPITNRSFTIMVIFFMIGTSILIAPNALALNAKQDAWLSCLLGVVINLLLVWLYVVLGERHPEQTLVGYSEKLLGKWIGKFVGLLFALFCYLLASLMVGDMGYFLTTQALVETPIEYLQMLFVVSIVVAIREGLQVYSRVVEIFFPWILLLFLVLIVSLAPQFDLDKLKPVLEFGMAPVMKGSFSFFSLQEMVVLLMLYPFITKGKGRGRGFIIGTLIGGIVLVVTTMGSIVVLDYTQTANNFFPTYVMAKNISIGQFLERLEGMMMLIWILSIFVKVAITFHAAIIGIAQVFRIDEKILIWPLAIGMIVLSLMCYTNVIYVQHFLSLIWTPFASVFMLVIPLILLGVSLLRKSASVG